MENLAEYLQLSEQLKQIEAHQKYVKDNIRYCISNAEKDLKSKLKPYFNELFNINNSSWDDNLIYYDYNTISIEDTINIEINIEKLFIKNMKKEFPHIKFNLRKKHELYFSFSYNILTSKFETSFNYFSHPTVENDDIMSYSLLEWFGKISEIFYSENFSFKQTIEKILSLKNQIYNLHSFYTLNKMSQNQ